MNAVDRTAEILLDDDHREIVSVLELDPHGTDVSPISDSHDGFGVRRGYFVLTHREGTTNGCERPGVPGIGETEPWAMETPFVEEDGEFTGWRKELDELGQSIARIRGVEPTPEGFVQRIPVIRSDIDWMGIVIDVSYFSIHRRTQCFSPSISSLNWTG